MTLHYFELKTNPNIVRIVDVETNYVSGTVGNQPKEYNPDEWIDKGEASYAKYQENIAKVFADFRKPENKKEEKTKSKALYSAVLKAGNSEEVARQVSGYLGA